MNKREAKRFVCARVADILWADTNLLEGSIYDDDRVDETDRRSLEEAIETLADELSRRGGL